MVDCKHLFQEFHPGRFLVFTCLLLFGILLSFRLDGVIEGSFWGVFVPLWIWKFVMIAGCIVGIRSYIIQQEVVHDMGTVADFQAMLLSTSLQILLLSFEACLCYKISFSPPELHWYLVFMPLFLLSALSIIICGWGWKKERPLDLELLFSVNLLQFVLIVLRLENLVTWSWQIILIPLWILLGICSLFVVYYIALTTVMMCTNDMLSSLRTPRTAGSFLYCVANLSLMLFLAFLAGKIDNLSGDDDYYSYIAIFIPYHLGMASLVVSTFYQKGGNPWWFGIREEFCIFLLKMFPAIRVYGNISYIYTAHETAIPVDVPILNTSDSKNSLPKVTFSNVELPD